MSDHENDDEDEDDDEDDSKYPATYRFLAFL
jgi:hypothetical protein